MSEKRIAYLIAPGFAIDASASIDFNLEKIPGPRRQWRSAEFDIIKPIVDRSDMQGRMPGDKVLLGYHWHNVIDRRELAAYGVEIVKTFNG